MSYPAFAFMCNTILGVVAIVIIAIARNIGN